jgi:hypothetical protein
MWIASSISFASRRLTARDSRLQLYGLDKSRPAVLSLRGSDYLFPKLLACLCDDHIERRRLTDFQHGCPIRACAVSVGSIGRDHEPGTHAELLAPKEDRACQDVVEAIGIVPVGGQN